jgi:hypothetical protein
MNLLTRGYQWRDCLYDPLEQAGDVLTTRGIRLAAWMMTVTILFEFATCWDSKRRVMRQEKFPPQGVSRVYIKLGENGGNSYCTQATCNSKQQFCVPN